MLLGREAECARIDAMLARASGGRSGVLVLRGDPGTGKSALLAYAQVRAGALRVLRATGIESEHELPYAGLHQLLNPVLGFVDRLPELQADALRSAFGLLRCPAGDRFLVSLGVLGLLSLVAEDRGVLCVVDDAHWLDRASADALVFAARRLEAEGVAIVVGAREGDERAFTAPGLPELWLGGLGPEAAQALLAGGAGADLAPAVRDRLLAVSAGNPLALVEIPRALRPGQLAGTEALEDPLPVGREVEAAFLGRIHGLGRDAQLLALLAAADDTGDAAVLTRAGDELGADRAAWDELAATGLVHLDGATIALRHPLVRSAVHGGAAAADRRRVHLALADALEGEPDAGRRIWHRAEGVQGPDEAIAADLEHAALDARRRSGHAAAAAAALERAATLSADPLLRGRRLLAAADASWGAGGADRVGPLLDRAAPLLSDPLDRAAVDRLRGSLELESGHPTEAYELLVSGATRLAPHHPTEALDLLARAAETTWFMGRVELSSRVRELGSRLAGGDDAATGFLVDVISGTARILHDDFEGGAEDLRRALAVAPELEPRFELMAGFAVIHLGEPIAAYGWCERISTRLRAAGALGELPFALIHQAAIERWIGRFAASRVHLTEGTRLGIETGQAVSSGYASAILAQVEAVAGDEAACRANARDATDGAAGGLGLQAANASWALGRLELGLGRPADALTHLLATADGGDGLAHPLVSLLAVPDLVEAAVRAGRPDVAVAAAERFGRWERASGSGWTASVGARIRGMLADDAEAEDHFATAVDAARDRLPFDAARARLAWGERLRRERRRTDAREHLRAALAGFDSLGALPWAARARGELRAAGEVAPGVRASVLDDLTPQELQIARMVADGDANRVIASRLFLSVRTVEYHLHKAFTKLGITSRHALARLVTENDTEDGPVPAPASARA